MKKVMAILFAVMLLSSSAMAESNTDIVFQSIPWLSDDAIATQTLNEIGFLQNGTKLVVSRDKATYLLMDEMGFISPDRVSGADDVTFCSSLEGKVKGKIAGYPVKDIKLTFAYDGEYKLVAVNVDLIGGKYDDLNKKLTKVYGEAEIIKTEEGIISNIWKGANNSAVLLITYSEGLDYILMYGRLDAAEILSNCLAPADLDDVSGL